MDALITAKGALDEARRATGDNYDPAGAQASASIAIAAALIALVERLDKSDKKTAETSPAVTKSPKWDRWIYICPNCGLIKEGDVRQVMDSDNTLVCALCGSNRVEDAPF